MSGLVLAHGMGLKLVRVSFVHSLSLCSIFVPAFLVTGPILGANVFGSFTVLNSPLEVLPGSKMWPLEGP